MAAYLDGKEPDEATLKRLIRKAVITGAFYPVLCGSAFKNKGVQPLLDAVVDYLPSPLDVPAIKGIDHKGNEVERKPDDKEPMSLLAFKIMDDPFVGTITFCRIYSGTLIERHRRHQLDQGAQGAHRPHAADARQQPRGHQGSLCRRHRRAGRPEGSPHRRHAVRSGKPVILEKMEFPEPVIEIAIEPKSKADQEKLGVALAKLAAEDPSFRVTTDQESGQTILKGMGELHLDIKVDILKRTYKVEANIGAPQVAYREKITRKVTESTTPTRSRPAAPASSRAVKIVVEPLPPGTGFEFENEIVGGAVPKEYIPGVEKGLESVLGAGVLAGFPVVDLKVTLIDGDYHDVDSSALAFEIAARTALREALQKGGPVLLEPIMKVEVVTPEDYTGSVIGDLNSRRGQIQGQDMRGNANVITAMVPLANMFGYVNNLRSMSQGRATFTMQFDHYAEVPQAVAEEVQAKFA